MTLLKNIRKKNLLLILYISLFIFLLTFMNITFNEDEEVTMGFMTHSLKNIINIGSLDVHPPLYYLILKIFLNIFTFWTKSFFIKTIVARIFSFSLFILGLHYLFNILYISNIKLPRKYVFLVYCFMPSILEVATHCRMYELATFFIIIEYYNLIRFDKYKNNLELINATIFALLAGYTQYYMIIVSLVLLFVFCIKTIIKSSIKVYYKYIVSFLLYLIMYLPMVPYVFHQFINRSTFPSDNTGDFDQTISSLIQLTSSGSRLKEIFDIGFIISLFLFVKLFLNNFNNLLLNRFKEIISCIAISVFIEIIITIIYKPFFECRFIFPLISIYFFFVAALFLYYFQRKNYKNTFILILFLVCLMFISVADLNKGANNIKQYDYPSIQLINNFNRYKKSSKKNIILHKNSYPTQFKAALYYTQNSVYLKSINKDVILNNAHKTDIYAECNGNKRFVHKLFNNLIIRY